VTAIKIIINKMMELIVAKFHSFVKINFNYAELECQLIEPLKRVHLLKSVPGNQRGVVLSEAIKAL